MRVTDPLLEMVSTALSTALLLAASVQTPTGRIHDGRSGGLEIDAPRENAQIVVDGSLNEAVWQRAAQLTGFSQYAPVDGQAADDSTQVLVCLRDDGRTNDPIVVGTASGRYVRALGYRVKAIRPELLFSFTPSPGTVVFVGYGGQLVGEGNFDLRGMEREREGFFVKMSYLFRR